MDSHTAALTDVDAVTQAYTDLVGRAPAGVWAAPGRVNLIGEHTDYNDGYVMPFALRAAGHRGRRTAATTTPGGCCPSTAARPRRSAARIWCPACRAGRRTWPGSSGRWTRPDTTSAGPISCSSSDVPIGAGLSSSAALECATLAVLADLDELVIEPMERAKLARRAENAFVGAPTGQMDQAASTLCEAGNALFFDCRSFDVEQVPLDLAAAGLELLVLDTRTPHALVDSEYAARRETCEAAAAILGVPALRDVTDLDAALDRLDDEVMRKRVRHVVTENQRVLDAADRLHAQDYLGLAPLLDASHASMRDDFEITVPTVDLAVQVATRGRGARRPDDRWWVRRLHHRPGRPGPLRRGGPGHLRGVRRRGLRPSRALRRSPLGRSPPPALSPSRALAERVRLRRERPRTERRFGLDRRASRQRTSVCERGRKTEPSARSE